VSPHASLTQYILSDTSSSHEEQTSVESEPCSLVQVERSAGTWAARRTATQSRRRSCTSPSDYTQSLHFTRQLYATNNRQNKTTDFFNFNLIELKNLMNWFSKMFWHCCWAAGWGLLEQTWGSGLTCADTHTHTHTHTLGFCLSDPFFRSYPRLGRSPKVIFWALLCRTSTSWMSLLSPNQQHQSTEEWQCYWLGTARCHHAITVAKNSVVAEIYKPDALHVLLCWDKEVKYSNTSRRQRFTSADNCYGLLWQKKTKETNVCIRFQAGIILVFVNTILPVWGHRSRSQGHQVKVKVR